MDRLALLDWRRRVSDLYSQVREATDPRAAHAHWCATRQELYRTHPQSAARSLTLHHAPYDEELRFVVDVDTSVVPKTFETETATDGRVHYERVGRVTLDTLGALDVWWIAAYGGGIWLPVRDTSPRTYGGGRYVLDTIKGADLGGQIDLEEGHGELVVDLNFAYNPSCAYDEGWACPLPPADNTLNAALEVGELLPEPAETSG